MAWKYECTVFVKPIKLAKSQKGGKRKREKRQEIERVREYYREKSSSCLLVCGDRYHSG